MLKKEYHYDSPELILLVSSKRNTKPYEIIFQRLLNKTNKSFALLPVVMKPKHIKNLLLTLNLMDIKGAYILDDIRRPIQKILKTSSLDNLTFKRKQYSLSSTYAAALGKVIKSLDLKGSRILLIGEMPQINLVASELSKIKLSEFKLFSKERKQVALTKPTTSPSLHCPNSKKLFNESISNTDYCIIAGSSNFKVNKAELKRLTSNCNVIDLREGFINYSGFKNNSFFGNQNLMALILAENIKLWTSEKLDMDYIRKEIQRGLNNS